MQATLLAQFSRRFLLRHPGQLLLALSGIAAGVAVVTGVALMRDVLVLSLDAAAETLGGRDSLRIEDPGGPIDERLFAELATSPGAPALMPVLRERIRYEGNLLELLGVDPLSLDDGGPTRLSGAATGTLLGTVNGVLANRHTLDRLGLRPGDSFTIRRSGREIELQVVAELDASSDLDGRLVMDLANAQHLLERSGELSWIAAPAAAESWLRQRLPEDLVLSDAGQRRDSAARLTAGMRTNLTAMSLLALVVGLFVIHSVLSFLLVQRRRQIGMIRAVGVRRGQVGALLAAETTVLAGFGALLGLALGTLLADQLLDLVRAPVAELYGLVPGTGIRPGPGLYIGIWSLSLTAALISVGGVLGEALRIPPGQLSRADPDDRPHHRRRIWISLVLAAAGLVTLFVAQTLNGILAALFVLLCSCALLAPPAGMGLLRLWHRLRPGGLSGRALGMLGSARQRLAPSLAALSLALGLSAGMAMMVMGFRVAVDDWVDRLLRADSYVTAARGQLGAAEVDMVNARPEVNQFSSVRQRQLPDGTRLAAYDLPDPAWVGFEWLAGGDATARASFREGRGVLISEPLARHRQLNVADRLEILTPRGARQLEIVAVYRDYASDRGVAAISGAAYREWFDDPVRDSLGLYLTDPQADLTGLLDQLESMGVEANLTRRDQVREQTLAVFDRTFRITWALALLVAVIAAIALISALLALGLERSREYATLRALGLTRMGLAAWVAVQTGGLAIVAAVLALPISLLIHIVLSQFVQPMAFGWSVGLTLPWLPWLVLLPLAALTGLAAGIYPAWTLARRDPAPLLRAD